MRFIVSLRVSYRTRDDVRRITAVAGEGDDAKTAIAMAAMRLHELLDHEAIPTAGRTVNLAEIEGGIYKWID